MSGECVYLFQSAIDRSIFCKVRTHAACISTSCRASILPWSAEERTKDLSAALAGSRRFICIKVTAPVDTNVSAGCRQLYAQVMTLICHGEGTGWVTRMRWFCINPARNSSKYRHWRNYIVVAFLLQKRKT